MKITWNKWYDRHGNRYILMENGNIRISIQMVQNSTINCYISIKVSCDKEITVRCNRLQSLKQCNKFIKETYIEYKHLYKLEKTNENSN